MRRFSAWGFVFSVWVLSGCGRTPNISEYPPFIDVPRGDQELKYVSAIIVGTVVLTSPVGSPHSSKWGLQEHTQLWKTTVQVENVLQGSVNRGELPVYYFVFADAYSGPPLLGHWRLGERRMFFLQRDNGVMRMICDNYLHCTLPVFTGRHRDAKSAHTTVTEEIAHFLVTRGENCTDAEVIQALEQLPYLPFEPLLSSPNSLREVKETIVRENLPVRREACKLLQSFGLDYRRNPYKENAQLYQLYHDPLEDDWREACKSVQIPAVKEQQGRTTEK